mgnify:FL=1|jgi:hypothetical protein
MTEEDQVIEVLMQASEYGIREEVIQYSRHLREINIRLNRIDAYEMAMRHILEVTGDE